MNNADSESIHTQTAVTERLYGLLPAIHRIRDAEQGYPLLELVAAIAEQVAAMEENLDQLYDDQFIETCAPWVAPYIGDLIGYRTLRGITPTVASPRADVANTIRFRRRKGTAAMLEQLARDVTGWPARAVEFFQLLGWTQYMNHLRPDAHYTPDLRKWKELHWRGTAFDTIAHTVDVRRISAGAPRHNIHNIGLYLWRVRAFSLTRASAAPLEPANPNCRQFFFNPLCRNTALYSRPQTEDQITHLAEPCNVPIPLSRRWLKEHVADYYGLGKSLCVEDNDNAISCDRIFVCDLSDVNEQGRTTWRLPNLPNSEMHVAIDPVLGRLVFSMKPNNPFVSFHYGFTNEIGGGEYERDIQGDPAQVVTGGSSMTFPRLGCAFAAVQDGGTVEIKDSHSYNETPKLTVNGSTLVNDELVQKTAVLRAANGARPLLAANGIIELVLGEDATLVLDGLVISGGALKIAGDAQCHLILRDCTLVPGTFGKNDSPGLVVTNPKARVELVRCITAPLHIAAEAEVSLQDSIVDATARSLIAFGGPTHKNGLYAEYFDDIDLSNRKLTRTDATVNFDWGRGTPDALIAANTFSARWTGCVRAPMSGTYVFHVLSDDGVRLWIDNQLLVDNWTDQVTTENSASISLAEGIHYHIRLEYYQNIGEAVIRLLWTPPDLEKQVIPQDCLYEYPGPGATLSLKNCTVIGKVHTQKLKMASDCIFVSDPAGDTDANEPPLWSERRQQGCIRFSYVPPGSRTPRRYHCQPDEDSEEAKPEFASLRYGDPGYCQLLLSTSEKIRRGAHDESEMGVMHNLYQPQREANLRVRLEEYLRYGLEAGLIYES